MITIYGISNCDKVKKAKAWLDKQNALYQFHNYKVLGCDQSLVDNLLRRFAYNEVINSVAPLGESCRKTQKIHWTNYLQED